MLSTDQLDNRFKYHKPDDGKVLLHEFIRNKCKVLAVSINSTCPTSHEALRAIECIEMAMMWANAAIARHDFPQTAQGDDGG